ncbi:hypothetical protein NQ315_008742, partial [Exocentrus adspersus]
GSAPVSRKSYPGCEQIIGQSFLKRKVPEESLPILLESLSSTTKKQYNTVYKAWWEFCGNYNIPLYEATVADILHFLQRQYSGKKLSYSSFNTYRSALALILPGDIGKDIHIRRFLKGMSNLRRPRRRYNFIWDPQMVLNFLSQFYPNEGLPMDILTKKLVTLLALVTAHRLQTLRLIKVENVIISESGIQILISDNIKTSGHRSIPGRQPTRPEIYRYRTGSLHLLKMESVDFPPLSEMKSQRGKPLLVVNNFKFKEHNRRLASGETKWRCVKDKCCAYVKTLGESSDRMITSLNENHTHEPEQENKLQRQILTYSSKRKAESDITEKPAKIIRTELKTPNAAMDVCTIKDVHCVRRNIYYARRKLLPALPKSILEVHEAVNKLQPKTKSNEVEDFYFFELYELKPENLNLDNFSDYLLENYLTNESKFPPRIWASASADLNKTTNAIIMGPVGLFQKGATFGAGRVGLYLFSIPAFGAEMGIARIPQPCLQIPFFRDKPQLSVASALLVYIERTERLRNDLGKYLFITCKAPYRVASGQTLSRWIKETLKEAGVDTSIFTGYSTRHAPTSSALRAYHWR